MRSTGPVLSSEGPARVLGAVDATCVVVGAIVGVGIFFTPSRVAKLVDSAPLALLAWALGGAIALCGALAFAELGGLYHSSGAQYAILRDSYGPMTAFLFVFCNATAIQAGAVGIIAVICAQNLAVTVGAEPPQGFSLIGFSALLIVVLAGANLAGVRWGARIQNLTVYAKVLALLAVGSLALVASPAAAPGAAPDPARAGVGGAAFGVMAALVPALFSYGGWQHALWISGEVRDPGRTLPRAIVGGVVIVIAVYLLANWAYLRVLGTASVAASQALAADAVSAVLPGSSRRLVAGAVAISAFGVLNAQLLSGPRLVYGMACDGRFFRPFGVLGRRSGTPGFAIALIAGMALLLLAGAGPGGVDRLLTGVVFIDGIFFALTGAALLVLRRRRPAAERPVRVPGYPLVPLLFVIGEVGVVAGAYLDPAVRRAAVLGAAWIAAAALLYVVRFRRALSASG